MDPLFKKASADFDEGGAKGLLLNHLAIDGRGRIVFDSSDDANEDSKDADVMEQDNIKQEENDEDGDNADAPEEDQAAPKSPNNDDTFEENTEIDVGSLASKFFPDMERLEEQDICPSLKNFDLGDPSGTLDIPLLKASEDWRNDKSNDEARGANDPSGIMLDDDNAIGFDDDDASLGGFDLKDGAGFGDGGEVWAREAALEPMLKVHRVDQDGDENQDGEEGDQDAYTISLAHQPGKNSEHENILSYFDNALQKNWAGPEHWKIRRIKETTATSSGNAAPKQRKEKEPFEIDFGAPLDPGVAEVMYTAASSSSAISLPKTQWKTKGRNLLPDDKHFNSRQLLRLFLKPKARMGSKRLTGPRQFTNRRQENNTAGNGEMDEAFWANHKTEEDPIDEEGAPGAYDADFFADDDGLAFPAGLGIPDEDDDNLPFADAREMLSPTADAPPGATDASGQSGLAALLNGGAGGGFGSQLVTQGGRRARPDYVAYARVAKKVDVRRLKSEMWRGMGDRLIDLSHFDTPSKPKDPAPPREESSETDDGPPTPTQEDKDPQPIPSVEGQEGSLRFTHIMNSLKASYNTETLRDISTSYGFICLLHLANEQGLVLHNNDISALEEIFVAKDPNAVLEESGM